jgi:hypothetical protein
MSDTTEAAGQAAESAADNTSHAVVEGTPKDQVPVGEGQPPAQAATETAIKPVVDPRMSERFARLQQREREVVEKQQRWAKEHAAREGEIKARMTSIEQERAQLKAFQDRISTAKTNPGPFLRELYGDAWYDHLTQYQLSGETKPPPELEVAAIRDEIKTTAETLRKEQEERIRVAVEAERKQLLELQRKQLQAEAEDEIQRFDAETVDFVKQNASKYELTTLYGQEDLVPQVIRAAYEEGARAGKPRILTREEAANLVEHHLTEQAEKAARVKQRRAQEAGAAQPSPQGNGQPAPTLTNSVSSAPGLPGLSRQNGDQRMARALAAWDSAAGTSK